MYSFPGKCRKNKRHQTNNHPAEKMRVIAGECGWNQAAWPFKPGE
jgi:hypothetical protein